MRTRLRAEAPRHVCGKRARHNDASRETKFIEFSMSRVGTRPAIALCMTMFTYFTMLASITLLTVAFLIGNWSTTSPQS